MVPTGLQLAHPRTLSRTAPPPLSSPDHFRQRAGRSGSSAGAALQLCGASAMASQPGLLLTGRCPHKLGNFARPDPDTDGRVPSAKAQTRLVMMGRLRLCGSGVGWRIRQTVVRLSAGRSDSGDLEKFRAYPHKVPGGASSIEKRKAGAVFHLLDVQTRSGPTPDRPHRQDESAVFFFCWLAGPVDGGKSRLRWAAADAGRQVPLRQELSSKCQPAEPMAAACARPARQRHARLAAAAL